MLSSTLHSTHEHTTSRMACMHGPWAYTRLDDVGHEMPSLPFGSTQGRAMTVVTCHIHPWTTHTVGGCRLWHAIIALGQHTRVEYVRHGMPSLPLDSTHGRTMSGVAGHHHPYTPYIGSKHIGRGMPSSSLDNIHDQTTSGVAYVAECYRVLNAIISLGRHTRSHYFGCGMLSSLLHTPSDDIECDMPSSPLDSTHGGTSSGVTDHHLPWTAYTRSENVERGNYHRPWTTYTVGRRRALHATPLEFTHGRKMLDVAMLSSPLGSTHDIVERHWVLEFYHSPWAAHMVERCRALNAIIALWNAHMVGLCRHGMPSSPLDNIHRRTTLIENTVELCWAWYDIMAIVRHTRSNDIGRFKPSFPFDSIHRVGRRWAWHAIIAFDIIHGRKTLGVECYHRPRTAHTAAHAVGRCRTWHAIIAIALHTQLDDVRRDTLSLSLDNTHGGTTSVVECHHLPWTTYTVERRRSWHAIMALEQQTRSDYVGRGRPSSNLGSIHRAKRFRAWHAIIDLGHHTCTHGRATSIMAYIITVGKHKRSYYVGHCNAIIALGQHTESDYVGCGMLSYPLESIHDWKTSGLACYHLTLTAQMVRRRRRGTPSSPLDCKHGRMTLGVENNHLHWAAHAIG
ncbi:hypothetical protein EJD97_021230 [Solanum chilense]|uniref:Uncharacterized protein n=1 Tax=Solanum chilense TaxID=4083 RepID=A0A6N2B3M9_SOLCI|nr:hypothetical protein EJD97_021230 [Solanum chilense]